MSSGNDLLFGTSAPSAAFDAPEGKTPGTVVRGRITAFDKSHRREVKFDGTKHTQGEPLYWNNGKPTTEKSDRPVEEPVLTIQTTFTKWEAVGGEERKGTDDGLRRVFLKGRSKKYPGDLFSVAREAILAAGARKVEVGDFVEIECVGQGKPIARGLSGPKMYKVTYWTAANAPSWADEVADDADDTEENPLDNDDDDPFA